MVDADSDSILRCLVRGPNVNRLDTVRAMMKSTRHQLNRVASSEDGEKLTGAEMKRSLRCALDSLEEAKKNAFFELSKVEDDIERIEDIINLQLTAGIRANQETRGFFRELSDEVFNVESWASKAMADELAVCLEKPPRTQVEAFSSPEVIEQWRKGMVGSQKR
jgi:hypothetical protein